MKHKTIQEKLLRYLDDELSEKEKLKVQRHLESCQTCREALKVVESLWSTRLPIERESAPPFLWTRISTRMQSETEQGLFKKIKKPVRLALRAVTTLAVMLLIFFSGIKLGNLVTGLSERHTEISTERITDNFGMNYFEILPPGSIDARVLALTESEKLK